MIRWVSTKTRNSSALAMELRLSCTNPSVQKLLVQCGVLLYLSKISMRELADETDILISVYLI